MNTPLTQRLLARTAGRLYLARLGGALYRNGLIAAGVAVLALIAARLLALISPQWVVQGLWVPALLAVAVAFALTRKPTAKETARVLDTRTGSKELFLTTALLANSTGSNYSPIVVEQAEQRAGTVKPQQVVPFSWQRGTRNLLGAAALVAVLALWLPQLDPFKRQADRDRTAKQEKQLEQTKKATAARAEQLAQQEAKENDKVKQALAALEKTYKEAKPQERQANLQKLGEHQKQIGELWRQAASERRNDAQDQGAQKFGQANPRQTQEWKEQLKKGDASGLKKEMEAIRNEMQKLSQMAEGAEKRAAQENLAQRMNQLSEGMKQTANSPQMQAALQRAMEQMDLSKTGSMSKEALEAAQQSMQLSQQEADQLAQAMQNQQSLEDALQSLQNAKQLADQGKLDGQQSGDGAKSMAEYAAMYQKMCQGSGEGGQPGTGGMGKQKGQGFGGKAEENDEAETGFQRERSPTQLAAGQTLLQWKTQETGPTGARTEDYKAAVQQVKQGVSEAIAAEQVPPGYHQAIQKYFDTLPAK